MIPLEGFPEIAIDLRNHCRAARRTSEYKMAESGRKRWVCEALEGEYRHSSAPEMRCGKYWQIATCFT
ncbi:hypothetical protein [Sodalis sp.]|uniref:hypothetical protein n=1 Tax=Sodalis sp. (in: enterobacteria) TaxID=1898979 RepID=UPI0038732F1D